MILRLLYAALALMSVGVRAEDLTPALAARFANLALACVGREYPNKIAHALNSDADVKPPRELTPAFYGCYDWHSSVHGHWLLARLARMFPDAPFAAPARLALDKSLTTANLKAEADYVSAPGRESFERPYGLAWLLELSAELHQWNTPQATKWLQAMQPLETAAVRRISTWLEKLPHPVRSGEHSNTAFALGLMLDYSRSTGASDFERILAQKIREFYFQDVNCPVSYEPSGEDFLSPCLAEADAVRRVIGGEDFAHWFGRFLPSINTLEPAVVMDPTDGKLAHLYGLNLSRAWMLEGIASALQAVDPARSRTLRESARRHAAAGLTAVTGEHYASGHWLGSFAVYLLTKQN